MIERDSSEDPRVNTNGDPRITLAVVLIMLVFLLDLFGIQKE